MKTIEKDELFENVRQFLKRKGIELTDGSYSQTIQKSCRILSDVVNLGQQGLERAKTGIDKGLHQVREAIQRKTAGKPPQTGKPAEPPPASGPAGTPASEAAASSAVPPPTAPEPGVAGAPPKIKPKRTASTKKKVVRKRSAAGSAKTPKTQ